MSEKIEFDFGVLEEAINLAPLRAPIQEIEGLNPLFSRMVAIDPLPELDEEWVTLIAMASLLPPDNLVLHTTYQQVARAAVIIVQGKRMALGLEPNWDELDIPDEEGGVN